MVVVDVGHLAGSFAAAGILASALIVSNRWASLKKIYTHTISRYQ